MFCVLKFYFVDFNGMFTSFHGCKIPQSENAYLFVRLFNQSFCAETRLDPDGGDCQIDSLRVLCMLNKVCPVGF